MNTLRKSVNKKTTAKKAVKSNSAKKKPGVAKKKTASKKASAAKTVVRKSSTSNVNFAVIEEYLDFMEARGLNELEYSVPSLAIKLKRGGGGSPGVVSAPAIVPAPAVSNNSHASNSHASEEKSNSHVVKSPFVGTFYRSAGPNQEPFIEEGKTVGSGDVLCIVEAMKLMNEIESDIKGRIKKILVKDATPVEFGEPLFEVDPL